MAAPMGVTSSTTGGEAASFTGQLKQYYAGSPGTSTLPVGAGCTEQRALEAGGAVTMVAADKHCQLVQGIRIIIGDTAESIQSGFEMVNVNFHTSGTQVSIASNFNLSAPVAT